MIAKQATFDLLNGYPFNVGFQIYGVRDKVKELTGIWMSDTTASRYLREYRELHSAEFGVPNIDKKHGMYRKEMK